MALAFRTAFAAALISAVVVPHAGAQVGPNEVGVVGFRYTPPVTVVTSGQAVKWTNLEVLPIPHNVAVDAHVSPAGTVTVGGALVCPTMNPGGSCTRTAGSTSLPRGVTFYTCLVDPLVHTPQMKGVIVVV